MSFFQTLQKPVEICGVGLHSGLQVSVQLQPSEQCGWNFVRTDLPGQPQVAAVAGNIASTLHATTLDAEGAQVSTPEHLLAALWALGITHCRIEIDGPEVPILDGSSLPWCELVTAAGVCVLEGVRPEYSLREPLAVYDRDGCVLGLPHATLRVTADVEYSVPYLETQSAACEVTPQSFHKELAAARTFTLEDWLEPLRAQGLIRGGSVENALVLFKTAPSSPLRFSNELARHKLIDAIGDLALMFGGNGGVLHAHIIAIRAGHELHRQWMQKAMEQEVLLIRRE